MEPELAPAVCEDEGGGGGGGSAAESALSAAQRARAERQRLRARELREARLVARAHRHLDSKLSPSESAEGAPRVVVCGGARLLDSGGGFLLPADEPAAAAAAPRLAPAPAAPLPRPPHLQPRCAECDQRFEHSYLLETFDYSVCDACRDDDEAHALLTRTEARSEFLLKECDLDMREPPLRCVRRRNPHRGAAHDMRLYLRAQVEERALAVWGGAAGLQAERERRAGAKERGRARRYTREVSALRRAALGVPRHEAAQHEHAWGPETRRSADPDDDTYTRVCTTCKHEQLYEKM